VGGAVAASLLLCLGTYFIFFRVKFAGVKAEDKYMPDSNGQISEQDIELNISMKMPHNPMTNEPAENQLL
jgi:hypothetical protein